ncbi:hypothetical protein TNCV_4669061 [Trichonephila clavipes]|nr:hypothetical protein TNCV_4669061 [Trichonephila clavipes]
MRDTTFVTVVAELLRIRTLACHELQHSAAEDLLRLDGRCTLNLAQTPSRWCGVEVRREVRSSPSGSNDSSGIVNDNLRDSAKSDPRVSLVDNGLVGPYLATVLVTLPSAPDYRPPRLASSC